MQIKNNPWEQIPVDLLDFQSQLVELSCIITSWLIGSIENWAWSNTWTGLIFFFRAVSALIPVLPFKGLFNDSAKILSKDSLFSFLCWNVVVQLPLLKGFHTLNWSQVSTVVTGPLLCLLTLPASRERNSSAKATYNAQLCIAFVWTREHAVTLQRRVEHESIYLIHVNKIMFV